MTTVAVIDGDVIAYKAAAANESRTIVATHLPSGNKKKFKHRTEFREFLTTVPKFTEDQFSIEDVQTAEPVSFALHTIKRMIDKICDACGTRNYQIVLSSKENFRLSIALPKLYKSGREDNIRPLQLKQVREYLLNFHGAVEAPEGVEADDDLASRAYQGWKEGKKIIQCTVDKDAYGCIGWLYNWDKMEEPVLIEGLGELHMEGKKVKGTGRKWLYCQSVLGDPVDTYRPADLCKGAKFGDAAALKLLGPCTTDKECWEAIYGQYLKWYPEPFTYTAWDGSEHTADAIDVWQMYMNCAHMRRWEDDEIDVRKVLTKYGII